MSEEILSVLAPESTEGQELNLENSAEATQSTEVGGEPNEEKELSFEELKAERERLKKELEEKEQEVEKTKHGYEKRLSKEVAKRKSTQAELQAKILAYESQKPARESYNSDEEFYRAVGAFEAKTQEAVKQIQAEAQEYQKVALNHYEESAQKLATLIPDHNAVVSNFTAQNRLDQDILSFVTESDLGPVIMVHLAKNPKDWESIKTAPPSLREQSLRAIERFYDGQIKQRSTKTPSKAPEPIKNNSQTPAQDGSNLRGQARADWLRAQRKR
jgi:hypothetical protein